MPPPTSPPRRVRLFRNNRNQAVHISGEFDLPGNEAFIYRNGTLLIIEPVWPTGLAALLESWTPLDDAFPDLDDPPPPPRDIL